MVEKWGISKTIQYLISFGNTTWNSSGVAAEGKVWVEGKNMYESTGRSTFGFDLFTKKADFLNLLKTIDPTIKKFDTNTITRIIENKKFRLLYFDL